VSDAKRRGPTWSKAIGLIASEAQGATGADLRELIRRGILRHGEQLTASQLVALASDQRWTGADKNSSSAQ
jgi:hypothetical protein